MNKNEQKQRIESLRSKNAKAFKFIEREIGAIIKCFDDTEEMFIAFNFLQCWRLCEKIVKKIYHNMTRNELKVKNLYESIELLKKEGYITEDVESCLHLIRIYTNKEKHDAQEIELINDDIYLIIEAMIKILIWYGDKFVASAPETPEAIIIIMADIPELYSRKLVNHVYKTIVREIVYISEGHELLSFDLDPESIIALALIITDTTRFSEDEKKRDEINDKIFEYVERGGLLIATSDVIYRRTRNNKLQKLFGCVVDDFKRRESPVKYIKTDECRNIEFLKELDESFELTDGVINIGKWTGDYKVLFRSEEGHPLVVLKEYGKGICFWLNGGDYRDYPPKSIALPEKPLINLIQKFMKYFQSREFYKSHFLKK